MQQKKAYEQPKAGIFYMIPDLKSGKYDLYPQFEENGEEVTHLFLWDQVAKKLQLRSKIDESSFLPHYQGIPRGRIIAPFKAQDTWIIGIGGDFPLEQYKQQILSDFNLSDAFAAGKVKFEVQDHEKMNVNDKKTIEALLGIEMNPSGIKLKKKKKSSEQIIEDLLY